MKVSKEFKVGLFMVVALVLLYFGFNFLKGIDFFSSSHKYYAVYNNVDKLTESNQVFLNGFAVGRVADIEILQDNGNLVLVTLEIDSDIKLTDSTTAILTGDFLGNKSILLQNVTGSRILEPGDTLRSNLDRGITDILAESAVPVADNLQVTLRKFNVLVEKLTRNTEQLDTIFSRLATTPYHLNRALTTAGSSVHELATDYRVVAQNLNSALEDLRPTMTNLRTLSDSLKVMELNATITKTQAALESFNAALGKMTSDDNTVGKMLTEDELYNNLNNLLLNLDSLADHFNSNPKHFLAPLGKSKKKIERDLKKNQE
ncbi:MAG TPA: MlaD family protein [Cyclobacteriaceae bacterium]|jgi:phospholipid/cholesterol/gamma-HCH transport system substrate-binding protein